MKVIIGDAAKIEIDDGFAWYNAQKTGLGAHFVMEVESTIGRILIMPALNKELSSGIRRILVRRFPFMVIYSFNEISVTIIAVAHQHRLPHYWKSRNS